jgi:hypothetical protein
VVLVAHCTVEQVARQLKKENRLAGSWRAENQQLAAQRVEHIEDRCTTR